MTDNRTTELLPCPFCGGEADEYEGDYGNGIYCMMCGAMVGEPIHLEYMTTKRVSIDEAIAAWNARAELGSEPPYDELLRCLENDWHIRASWDGLRKFWCIELTEEGVKLRDAARAERTCRNTHENRWFKCSACGYGFTDLYAEDESDIDEQPRYCPNCGRKVVDA